MLSLTPFAPVSLSVQMLLKCLLVLVMVAATATACLRECVDYTDEQIEAVWDRDDVWDDNLIYTKWCPVDCKKDPQHCAEGRDCTVRDAKFCQDYSKPIGCATRPMRGVEKQLAFWTNEAFDDGLPHPPYLLNAEQLKGLKILLLCQRDGWEGCQCDRWAMMKGCK